MRDVLRVQPEVIPEGPLQTILNLREDGEELHDDDADDREVDEAVQRLKPESNSFGWTDPQALNPIGAPDAAPTGFRNPPLCVRGPATGRGPPTRGGEREPSLSTPLTGEGVTSIVDEGNGPDHNEATRCTRPAYPQTTAL